MPISQEQRALINALKEHLSGPLPDDLRREIGEAVRKHDEERRLEEGLTWIDKTTGTIVGSISKLVEKYKGENLKE